MEAREFMLLLAGALISAVAVLGTLAYVRVLRRLVYLENFRVFALDFFWQLIKAQASEYRAPLREHHRKMVEGSTRPVPTVGYTDFAE